jgi:uncharacterized protein (DUF342 family)
VADDPAAEVPTADAPTADASPDDAAVDPVTETPETPAGEPQGPAAGLRVTIAEDLSQAVLHVAPAEAVRPLGFDDYWAALRLAGVKFGIDVTALEAIPPHGSASYVVATDAPEEWGEDGHLEVLVSAEFDARPEEQEGGRVDFRAAAHIPEVAAGQVIARVVEPTDGRPGRSVLGTEIPTRPGRPGLPRFLEGVDIADGEVRARFDGLLETGEDRLAVSPSLVVPGDLDYHTGSIQFHGDVVVGGTVHPGFKVDAEGRVLVWGDVDNAEIAAGRSVWVRGAVAGPEALVRSKADVRVRTVYEGRIEAHGSVYVEREVKDATILAGLDITTLWPRGRMYGGFLRAGRQVVAVELGSLGEEDTHVSVGGDPFGGQLLTELRNERATAYARLEDVRAQLIPFRARPGLLNDLDLESRKEIEGLEVEEQEVGARLATLDERIADLDPTAERTRVVAKIAVRPGVLIEVHGAKRRIRMTHHAIEAVETNGRVQLEPAKLTPVTPPFRAFGTVVKPVQIGQGSDELID